MPTPPVIKVLVTHRGAARTKYGSAGWTRIRHALTELVTADKVRGITTRVYTLDSAADANKVHAQVVPAPTDGMTIKVAIDRIYAAWQPAYVVLVGGPDLVGTVSLTDPLWTGDPGDDPRLAPPVRVIEPRVQAVACQFKVITAAMFMSELPAVAGSRHSTRT